MPFRPITMSSFHVILSQHSIIALNMKVTFCNCSNCRPFPAINVRGYAGDGRLRLKCDGTRAETRFRLSANRKSPFKSAGASVQSTAGSRGVRISGSNAGYTMFLGSVKSTGYPLHSSVSPSLPLPCVTVCHHISAGLYSTLRY